MPGPLQFILPPFQSKAPGITISASSSATAAVPLPRGQGSGQQVRIVNEGPNVAFLAFGKTGVIVATLPIAGFTSTCTAVLSGEDVILTLEADDAFISAVCRSTQTAVLSVYVGTGQ